MNDCDFNLPSLESLPSISAEDFEDNYFNEILHCISLLNNNCKLYNNIDSNVKILRIIRNALGLKLLKSIDKRHALTESVLRIFPIILGQIASASENDVENLILCITCCLQVFINNFACCNGDTEAEHFAHQILSSVVTEQGDHLLNDTHHHKISSYSALLFSYTLRTSNHHDTIWDSVMNKENFTLIIEKLLSTDDNNFLIFLERIILYHHRTICQYYLQLNLDHRHFLIQCIDSIITNNSTIHQDLLLFLSAVFSTQSESLIIRANNNCQSVRETLSILDVLAKLSEDSKNYPLLRRDTVFIKCCVNTLKLSLEEAEKYPSCVFATISKCSNNRNEEDKNSLVYGLKRNLITCLGNLAHGDRENQTLIGQELDALPSILACTCIDDRNPFIQQWAVLAVKFLVENHDDNKNIVRAIHDII